MKSALLSTTLLAVSLLGAFGTASAETLRAKIPFGFLLNGKEMPPGTYSIRTLDRANAVLLFANEETKMKTMAFARSSPDSSGKAIPLKFMATGGELMELVTLKTSSDAYELVVPAKKNPLKDSVLALKPAK